MYVYILDTLSKVKKVNFKRNTKKNALKSIFKEKIKVSFQDVRTQVGRLNAFLQEHITIFVQKRLIG